MCSFTDKLRTAKNFELLLERDEITWTLKIVQDENYNKEHKVDELMLSKCLLCVSSFKNTFLHQTSFHPSFLPFDESKKELFSRFLFISSIMFFCSL